MCEGSSQIVHSVEEGRGIRQEFEFEIEMSNVF